MPDIIVDKLLFGVLSEQRNIMAQFRFRNRVVVILLTPIVFFQLEKHMVDCDFRMFEQLLTVKPVYFLQFYHQIPEEHTLLENRSLLHVRLVIL